MTNTQFTVPDLQGLPMDDGNRYELIDGELYVTTQPHRNHQSVATRISTLLDIWTMQTGNGIVIGAPGVEFAPGSAVAPDVVWASDARYALIANDDGKLHGAPELAVEILSPGSVNESRDRDYKYKLYSQWGVQEYWIVDWRRRQIEIFRRNPTTLGLEPAAMAFETDIFQSPNLPSFTCVVKDVFGKIISI